MELKDSENYSNEEKEIIKMFFNEAKLIDDIYLKFKNKYKKSEIRHIIYKVIDEYK